MNHYKKQTKQLLLLAGLSGTGKSTLIKTIKAGKLPSSIDRCLGFENLSGLFIYEDKDLLFLKGQTLEESIMVHYDIYNNYLDKNSHHKILEIIKQFDRVVVVTLYVPTETLIKRLRLRIFKSYIRIFVKPWRIKKIFKYLRYQWTKYRGYKQTNDADLIYQEWLEFTKASWVAKHWVINSDQRQLSIIPLEKSRLDNRKSFNSN